LIIGIILKNKSHNMIRRNLLGMTAEDILALISPSGYKLSDAVSIAVNIYKKRITEISELPKTGKSLKELLMASATVGFFSPVASEISADRSVKYLFRTADGKEFETVYIPDGKRSTVCVSTQAGCRMGCAFCATAKIGFMGNLSAGEIINQILSIGDAGKVTHVVFMGMGEPMDNLAEVLKACEILTAEWGLSLGCRNVTVSTVGITPGIEIFLSQSECNLTLSLHSPFSEEREKVIPAGKKYPLKDIIPMMKGFPVKKGRRLTMAYVMISGLNDTDLHLDGLIGLLKGSGIRVNLLPYHKLQGDKYESSSSERMLQFKHSLVLSGISASVRRSRGLDISAACGLLAAGIKPASLH
jgi:23S rRNA (adenine2503-C2)-methyltransferase